MNHRKSLRTLFRHAPDSRISPNWSKSKKLRKRSKLTEKSRCSSKQPWESQKEFWDEYMNKTTKKIMISGRRCLSRHNKYQVSVLHRCYVPLMRPRRRYFIGTNQIKRWPNLKKWRMGIDIQSIYPCLDLKLVVTQTIKKVVGTPLPRKVMRCHDEFKH